MAAEIMAEHENFDSIILNLEKKTENIHSDIRHIDNRYVIECISALLLNLAEQKYGDSSVEPDGIYMSPAFFELPRSRVGVTLETPDMPKVMHIICIGTFVRTWHQLFYELAHETLHLLGPTDSNKNPVARIEEGVAVKFAEDFYESFVSPIINQPPYDSPLGSPASVYYKAHKPTNKIPDDVLKSIRTEFKNFRDVKKEGLYALADSFITEDEAAYLSLPFDYKAF
jgi:hypothetical protein